MQIIVAQRHRENTEGIEKCVARIDPHRAQEIIFANNPQEVLRRLNPNLPALVVSGSIYGDMSLAFMLAEKVKRLNPQAYFFVYGIMTSPSGAIDGFIPKEVGTIHSKDHTLLARILTSPHEDMSPQRLKQLFPLIELQTP